MDVWMDVWMCGLERGWMGGRVDADAVGWLLLLLSLVVAVVVVGGGGGGVVVVGGGVGGCVAVALGGT